MLSEESGLDRADDRDVVVVLDPLDGSTNAAAACPGSPPACAPSTPTGPRAALVVDLANGRTFDAVRGGGAAVDGVPIRAVRRAPTLGEAVVGLSGCPHGRSAGSSSGPSAPPPSTCARWPRARSTRYVDCSATAHGPWDYLGGLLVCREAGAVVADALGRELVGARPPRPPHPGGRRHPPPARRRWRPAAATLADAT